MIPEGGLALLMIEETRWRHLSRVLTHRFAALPLTNASIRSKEVFKRAKQEYACIKQAVAFVGKR